MNSKNYILEKLNYDGNFEADKTKLVNLIQQKLEWNLEAQKKIPKLNKRVFEYVKSTKQELSTIFKNPLKELIWNWQDNLVFDYNWNWVIKIFNKQAYENNSNLYDYLTCKYKILKKFLWDYIPDSYFFEWETVNPKPISYSNLKDYKLIYPTIYTVQRKIHWYTLEDLPIDIRKNSKLINQLKQLHLNYISLKLYIHQLEWELFGNVWIVNFKSDLWKISKKIKIDEIIMSVKTPNIMWDVNKNKLFLIDFDSGSYNENVERIFNKLLEQDKLKVLSEGKRLFEDFKKYHSSLSKTNLRKYFSRLKKVNYHTS